jgi:hypothetical protein
MLIRFHDKLTHGQTSRPNKTRREQRRDFFDDAGAGRSNAKPGRQASIAGGCVAPGEIFFLVGVGLYSAPGRPQSVIAGSAVGAGEWGPRR